MSGAGAQIANHQFYRNLDNEHLSALWQVMGSLITSEPRSGCQPYCWKFENLKSYMHQAGELISAKEAERRVLILENPGLRGQSRITTSLFAGIQMVLPGEVAPAHRHSQSALRLVLEGRGAHTTVEGERTPMEPGDFVITPTMSWHDHGNESSEPILWLDGLDIPLVQFLDSSFAERGEGDEQRITRPVGDSYARYGRNLLPIDRNAGTPQNSPILNYPYAGVRATLEQMRAQQQWDPCHGLKLRYANPRSGGYALPTIGAYIQLMPAGFSTSRYRSTDATVFAVIEGSGVTRVGDHSFEWGPKDIFVVPSWQWVVHQAGNDAVLFSFSDRPVQEKLDLFREDRGNA